MSFFERFFSDTFMPHGYCFQWRPDILWTNVISDLLIAAAYFTIPVAILIFARERKDLEFKGVLLLFALFILFCGITHLMSIYNVWNASYGLQGILKAITAIVSILTAIVVFKNLKAAVALPSPGQMEHLIRQREAEKSRAAQLEIQRRADAIFRFTAELIPTGLLVMDTEQRISYVNEALASMFGYAKNELEGQNLEVLLEPQMAHHGSLIAKYLDKPDQFHRMASGRIVRGVHKDGSAVDIQISLAAHDFESERHAFASITDFKSFVFEQSQFNELSTRIQRAIDASNDGIWEWNVQSGEVWFSQQLLRLIGQTSNSKATFDTWKSHVHPKDWPNVEAALNKHLKHREKYDISYRGKGESGRYEWFHTRGDTLFDQDNNPILMSGTLSNINETKELEDRLEEQSQFLEQVLKRSLTGMYIFDLSTLKNTYINPEYTHLTGYTMDDLESAQSQDSLLPLFHPDDQPKIDQHFKDVIDDNLEQGVAIEYRFRHKDGSWRWFFSRDAIYSYDESGKPLKMLGSFFDITELKEREQEIRSLAIDYATTFEQAGVGIAHVSFDGTFIKVNNKLAAILGYPANELTELSFQEITFPADLDKGTSALAQLRNGDIQNYETEKRYVRKNGEVIWAHLTVSLVTEATLQPYFISIIEDITQRKEMQNRLSESNTALERFAYSASHDLQEPLRKISAFSGALERRICKVTDDEEMLMLLNRVSDASVRMSEMVDNLLELSRATRSPLSISNVSLSSIIAQSLDDLSTKLSGTNASVSLKKDGFIDIDPNAFTQVLRNLLSNSIKYRDSTRPLVIEIDFAKTAGAYHITVSDNGTGIPENKGEQIFEPFQRLVGRDNPGTGMGLAICRQIILAHSGNIALTTSKLGGATFDISLPIVTSIEDA